MRIFFAFCAFFVISLTVSAQTPRVPVRMEVAGIKLKISEGARKEIQADVDALTQSPKYFGIKVNRAKIYFPVIEKIFKEENVPDDIKYLVLQESALIADAVSSSKAVGYWQFKDFTAVEVGMRVDRQVDERMSIHASSRGAAKYLKKNNFYFNNWIVALQAYQMGPGGALKAVGKRYNGAKQMDITKKTYWYVKKYLAHVVAFRDAVEGSSGVYLSDYWDAGGKTFKDVARHTGVAEEELQKYNQWLKRGKIPSDKDYIVAVPMQGERPKKFIASASKPKESTVPTNYNPEKSKDFPEMVTRSKLLSTEKGLFINGKPGIVALEGEAAAYLASKGGIDLGKFLRYNDISIDKQIKAGEVYYYKSKRNKARVHYHVVQEGEDVWWISQKYGIKLSKLLQKNRMKKGEKLKPGRVLWLRFIRPKDEPIVYEEIRKEEEIKAAPKIVAKVEEEKPPERKEPTVEVMEKITEPEPVKASESTTPQKLPDMQLPSPDKNDTLAGAEIIGDENSSYDAEFVQIVHTVEQGQTYYAIAKMYNVNVLDILEWNGLDINESLSIGQQIIVIANEEKSQIFHPQQPDLQEDNIDYLYHEVKEGDTMYKVARLYGVTIDDIVEWNKKKDFELRLGERLKIVKAP